MKLIVVGALAATVFASSSLAIDVHTSHFGGPERAAAQAEAAKVRQVLEDKLLDYPAARFRKVRAIYRGSDPKSLRFCGEINARNRAGGYNGWRTFVATTGPDIFEIDEDVFYPTLCEVDGLTQDDRDYAADLTYR